MDVTERLRVPQDSDGFFSCNCPYCHERFKLHSGQFTAEAPSELTCPLCGLRGPLGEFTATRPIQEAARVHAQNVASNLLNEFTKNLERSFRGSSVRFKKGPTLRQRPLPTLRELDDLNSVTLGCCGIEVKVATAESSPIVYCPYCAEIQTE